MTEPDWDAIDRRSGALDEKARVNVDSFVGLSTDQAETRATDLGLTLRIAPPSGVVTADYRHGRITATEKDGVIATARVG